MLQGPLPCSAHGAPATGTPLTGHIKAMLVTANIYVMLVTAPKRTMLVTAHIRTMHVTAHICDYVLISHTCDCAATQLVPPTTFHAYAAALIVLSGTNNAATWCHPAQLLLSCCYLNCAAQHC